MILPTAEGASGQVYLVLVDFANKPATIATSATYTDELVKTAQGWRFKKRATKGDVAPAPAPPEAVAAVRPWELLGQTRTPDGEDMSLTRQGSEYVILASGKPLMSSRMHGSEEALAAFGCREARARDEPCVLVGGLGMGFTLRATLDRAAAGRDRRRRRAGAGGRRVEPRPARSAGRTSAEGHAGPESRSATSPRRCARAAQRFDAVLLDVDNGPAAFTASHNTAVRRRRDRGGAGGAQEAACWRSGRPGRIGEFEQRLRYGGFTVQVERVRGRLKKGGPRHTIFLGHL